MTENDSWAGSLNTPCAVWSPLLSVIQSICSRLWTHSKGLKDITATQRLASPTFSYLTCPLLCCLPCGLQLVLELSSLRVLLNFMIKPLSFINNVYMWKNHWRKRDSFYDELEITAYIQDPACLSCTCRLKVNRMLFLTALPWQLIQVDETCWRGTTRATGSLRTFTAGWVHLRAVKLLPGSHSYTFLTCTLIVRITCL